MIRRSGNDALEMVIVAVLTITITALLLVALFLVARIPTFDRNTDSTQSALNELSGGIQVGIL